MTPFELASLIGTIAFALSGFLLGVRKELDWMGLFIVAMLTANGGGVMRDVLVGRVPSVLIDISAFWVVFGVLAAALIFRLHRYNGIERRIFFIISDSVGLVAFSITGALVGLDSGLNMFGVMALAFLTATGGGIIRDILLNEVPAVLNSDFYGSVALISAVILYSLNHYDILGSLSITLTFIFALGLRLVAHRWQWHLPKVKRGHPYISEGE